MGHCLKKIQFQQVLTEESQHENAVVSYPQLVGVVKVVPCHKVVILQTKGRRDVGGFQWVQSVQQSQFCTWLFENGPARGTALRKQRAQEEH